MTYSLGIILFILDRILKYVANTRLILNNPLFNTPVDIMLYRNTGIALSLNIPLLIPIITGALALIAILYLVLKKETQNKPFLLIAALGIFSNLIDRIFLNYIVDYFKIGQSIINIADLMIVLGIFGYIYYNKK